MHLKAYKFTLNIYPVQLKGARLTLVHGMYGISNGSQF